jgi:hypothetical protein
MPARWTATNRSRWCRGSPIWWRLRGETRPQATDLGAADRSRPRRLGSLGSRPHQFRAGRRCASGDRQAQGMTESPPRGGSDTWPDVVASFSSAAVDLEAALHPARRNRSHPGPRPRLGRNSPERCEVTQVGSRAWGSVSKPGIRPPRRSSRTRACGQGGRRKKRLPGG